MYNKGKRASKGTESAKATPYKSLAKKSRPTHNSTVEHDWKIDQALKVALLKGGKQIGQ